MKFLFKLISNYKASKNSLLKRPVLFFSKRGFKSDHITLMSFIFGLFAVFFFEINNHLFLIFIVLSVCFDLLDGAFASIENKNEKAKKRGMLYDDISDRSVFILLILKIAFILKSFPVLLIALAYLLIKSVHILLKQKHSNKIQILYFDRLSLPILLFSYDIFFQVLVLVLFINILELLNILQEKNQ